MQVLKIDSGKSFFVVDETEVAPENISREDLLKILNDIYITNDEVNLPDKSTLDEIRNPVEKEIVCQIIQKIEDFTNNVENIRQEIQMQFPKI